MSVLWFFIVSPSVFFPGDGKLRFFGGLVVGDVVCFLFFL